MWVRLPDAAPDQATGLASPTLGRRLSSVLITGIAVAVLAASVTTSLAASTLDRSGRFAIKWWTIDDGLPEAPVNGVAFAPDGTLYCTTPTRIVRFDGDSFAPLPKSLTHPVQEAIGGFSNIGFDRDGRLWVQGGRAAAMLNDDPSRSGRRRWTVHVHPRGRFNSLALTAAGRPVLTGPNEVFVFDGKRFHEVANVVRSDKRVLWRYGDIDPTSGELWLWGDTLRPGDLRRALMPNDAGKPLVIRSDTETGGDVISLSFCPAGPLALLPECGAVRSDDDWRRLPPILPDADYRRSGKISWTADGTVWISSHNGIIACRDGVAEQVTSGLPGFSLRTGALVGDKQGGIWAACFGGLLAVRRTSVHVTPVPDCRTAFERADGSLLVGSPGVVAALAPIGREALQPIGTLAAASVPTAILEDAGGRIWVGTQDNFILRLEGGVVTQVTKPAEPFREFRNINALACDASGRVWAATANGLAVHDEKTDSFRTITPDDRTAQTVVIGLAAEADGSMLAAIQSRGIERISADGERSQILAAADMPGRRTIVFRRDSRGSLWIGGERGLVRHRGDRSPLRLSTASGLVDDAIRQIEEDQAGRLWLATRSGHLQGLRLDDLERLDRGELSIVRGVILGPLDGVGDAECTGRMGRPFHPGDQRLGRITIPVTNGIIRFAPADSAAEPTAGVTPSVTRDPDVPYGFQFATPGLHWAAPPMFQTRLAGVDDAWSTPSQSQRREYASLPPGDHIFEVRTITGENDQDFPLASLPVTVAAPLWRRPVTLAGFGIALAAMAATIARELTRRRSRRVIEALEWQRAMDRERARIARDIHDSLGAGLTRMAMMSDLARKNAMPQTNLPDRLDAIYRNARSLARSVDEIVWAVNPRNDTVSQFTSYVVQDVEEFVHAGDLSLRLDVPDASCDERPLPTHVRHHVCLAIREALQNVLRHAAATHVDFSIRLDDTEIHVVIHDDGVGFDTDIPATAGQDGLANMRHRVAEVGGSVAIVSAPRSGTTVTLRVPVDFRRPTAGVPPLEAIHDE
jgi:signal transduction histidine kinase/ligand-binding sensor domain-containing protein